MRSDRARVAAALRAGRPVVLPNPWPLTYVVAATDPAAVNLAKGRPADQNVAVWAHDGPSLSRVLAATELTAPAADFARHLLRDELLTVLLPVDPARPLPAGLAPAHRAGHLLLFGADHPELRPLLVDLPTLYVSSANRTGHPPAATPADATAMFPGIPLLPAEHHPGEPPRSATTTVRLAPDGRPTHTRPGAQDARHPSPAAHLSHLTGRHGRSVL